MIRDVMQNAGLEIFAEVGLIMFFVGFGLIVLRVALMRKDEANHAARIPLSDEEVSP